MINQGLEKFPGKAAGKAARLPVAFEGEGVELSVLKRAEKEDCLVVRLVERRGRRTSGVLSATAAGASQPPDKAPYRAPRRGGLRVHSVTFRSCIR